MNAPRRLLVVAPAFPPHPTPAAHRARLLAHYARSNGWTIEVLTVRPEFYEETLDEELLELVPSEVRITRVGALPARITRRFGIGDISLRSMSSIRRELEVICTARRPDAIFLSGPPFFPAVFFPRLQKRYGIPYVIDYTDPWVYPPKAGHDRLWKKGYWANRVQAVLEPRVVRHAAHIMAVSEGTNDRIRERYPELPSDRFSALPFGFEPRDFAALKGNIRRQAFWDVKDGCFHFAYVGVMPPRGFETLRALFKAVLRLRQTHPDDARRLRFHFIGTMYSPRATSGCVMPVASELGVDDVVDEHFHRVPYLDALRLLTAADGLLALGSTDHHYTASKIFPCILAGRPILAMFHEASNIGTIMREARAGELVTYTDENRAEDRVEAIAASILRILNGDSRGFEGDAMALLGAYSAERVSAHVFEVLERAVNRTRGSMSLADRPLARPMSVAP